MYYFCESKNKIAQVAELVDALVSNTNGAIRAGSSPALGTKPLCKRLFFYLYISYIRLYYEKTIITVSAIQEHTSNKELLKVTDILPREVNKKRNTPLFCIYNDVTVENKIIIE